MTNFMITVMIAVIKKLLEDKDFTDWVDARLAGVEANIKADLENIEDNVIKSLEALPLKIVGEAEADVKSLLGVVPGQVKDEVQPLIPTIDAMQGIFVNVLKSLPGGGILGGLFGGGR
jgi:hypothetical protein